MLRWMLRRVWQALGSTGPQPGGLVCGEPFAVPRVDGTPFAYARVSGTAFAYARVGGTPFVQEC